MGETEKVQMENSSHKKVLKTRLMLIPSYKCNEENRIGAINRAI
jgi:hypothetical protein